MAQKSFTLILLAAIGTSLAATPVVAQFGTIFGSPPRPPQNVPEQRDPWATAPPPRTSPSPQQVPQQAPQSSQSGVQSQPLPPPPGSNASPPAPPNAPGQQPTFSGVPPGQLQPAPPQPAEGELQPGDEVVSEPPAQKVENPTGIFAGLDKITGRITSFDVAIGETVQFGALQVTPRACYTRPPTETPHTDAFVEVDEVTLNGEIRRIFNGWMFAASPGLHAVEHPIYDVWLTDCKGGAVAEVQTPQDEAPPQTPRNQPQRRTPR
ncbi:MAG: DUF2155 domain-containing protein [Xanthobacteraceae bacterium]